MEYIYPVFITASIIGYLVSGVVLCWLADECNNDCVTKACDNQDYKCLLALSLWSVVLPVILFRHHLRKEQPELEVRPMRRHW